MEPSDTGPLHGIRVLELGNFIAAPFAARIFADFGAEVVKIESPTVGDELRGWRRIRGTTSMMFRTIARNKRSVTLDLRTDEGRQVVLELARNSDVVIENFRPGTLERWGIGPEELQAVRPDIVVVRISGYGQNGPNRDRAGFGGVAEAFGGLRHVTGYPDRAPVRGSAPIADTLAGLYGAISALMMLLARARGSGDHTRPQVADVSLYESVFMAMESLIPDYDAYGIVRERTGGNLPGVVPSGVYPCDGGSVMIAGNSSGVFGRLMTAIGRQDLADDPTLNDGESRSRREAELDTAISAWTSQRSPSDAVRILGAAGVPIGEVNDAAQIAVDEHFAARGMLQPLKVRIDDDPEEIRFPGVVPQFDGAPTQIRWAGPELGEHTDDVLTRVAGLSNEQLDDYRARGVI